VTVPSTNVNSAYYLVVTPAKSLSTVSSSTRYEAEYADLFGSATVTYGTNTGYSGTYFVQGYGTASSATTEFDVTAPANGFYTVNLRYSTPNASTLQIYLNGPALQTTSLTATANANTWASKSVNMFLTAGINRIAYGALSNGSSNGVAIDYIDVTPAAGTITNYQASSTVNTLGGGAVVQTGSGAPGGDGSWIHRSRSCKLPSI
jgi:Carbohydrate binding module (family 35)